MLDGLREPPLRNRDARGCLAVDDELERACGLAFSMVLDQVGVSTRAALCATSADSFDAGELAAELAHCIRRAQDAEIEDILSEVIDGGGSGSGGGGGGGGSGSGGEGGGELGGERSGVVCTYGALRADLHAIGLAAPRDLPAL